MSITDEPEKINPVVNFGTVPVARDSIGAKIYYWVKPFYTILLLVVISSIFFALGRLSTIQKENKPIKIEYQNSNQAGLLIGSQIIASSTEVATQTNQSGAVIGSKSGKKYYFPWCGTVKRIKPENQVHFQSVEEAKKAGFIPGGNCKGLK